MKRTLLLLGGTGKMGTALRKVLSVDYTLISKSSQDFDAGNQDQVKDLLNEVKPDIVINAVAMMGIDACEREPARAFLLNTLYPKWLAQHADRLGYLLVHFSTSSVFDGRKNGMYNEEDIPSPLNVYGVTKLGGDALIQAYAEQFYIFRIAMTFGLSLRGDQFTERMLEHARTGKPLRVADDVYDSPSYSMDIAREIQRILEQERPFDLYHICNRGRASLYELVCHLTRAAGLDVPIERASYKEFPHLGIKNTNTPLTTVRLNPLRSWQRAADHFAESWSREQASQLSAS